MKGLTSSQVSVNLKQYGFNSIKEQQKKPLIIKFIEQFNNFLTILLFIAAGFSFLIGEKIDGSLILAIVVLNGIFGVYQEFQAEESLAALKKMTITKVRVIRDGKEQEIDSIYLVPGDLVKIEEGTKISADGELIEVVNLEVNESVLTGESLAIPKRIKGELFSGTIVSRGRGIYQVTAIGMQTRFGKIAASLSGIKDTKTPLQKKLEELTRLIGIIGVIASILVFIISIIQGSAYFPAFLLAISLAVAVVPEGLPAVMTITLAIGVKVMAGKRSIIRKLSAIEALGSVTLIATDKTGTLTTNKMKVKEIYVDDQVYEETNFPRLENHPFRLIVENGVLCSTASLVYVHDHPVRHASQLAGVAGRGRWDVLGDPTEGALLFLSQTVGLPPEEMRKQWKIIDEVPFDSVSKIMTVLVQSVGVDRDRPINQSVGDGFPVPTQNTVQFIKGAPEAILERVSFIQKGNTIEKLTQEHRVKIEKQMQIWASKGLRVLGFAYKNDQLSMTNDQSITNNLMTNDQLSINNYQSIKNKLKTNDHLKIDHSLIIEPLIIDNSLIFLGLVAIHDAPRPEINEAVMRAKQAGVKVVMITGDNERTAEAIGVTAGIINNNEDIITGKQLDEYSDEQLMKILPRAQIFARTTPFHKHRIVQLYQKLGEVVVVTGDGVNDAIALKQADVGAAMGLVGTDVARETADMVITDDNFASIVNAIDEGRNIIKNLKNAIKYLLACNLSEAIALIVGLFLGISHLFYPIQLLYINLVTDGLPALALAFSPRDHHQMRRPPDKELSLLRFAEKEYIAIVGVITAILVLLAYFIFNWIFPKTGQTAAFTVLTLAQSYIYIDLWLSHQSLHKNLHLLKSKLFALVFFVPFILQFFIVKSPLISRFFKVKPLSIWQFIMLSVFSGLVLVEIKLIKKAVHVTT